MKDEITNENYVITYNLPHGNDREGSQCRLMPHPLPDDHDHDTYPKNFGWSWYKWKAVVSGKSEPSAEAGGYHGMVLAALACDLMIQGVSPEEIKREFAKIPAFRQRMTVKEDFWEELFGYSGGPGTRG